VSSLPGAPEAEEPSRKRSVAQRVARDLSSTPDATGTTEWPRWLKISRQIAVFLLGVGIIVYSVSATSKNIAYIITGLVLIGLIPLENFLDALSERMAKRQ
jgi:archaellum biogenesis protein FlaJ (TadC family)